VRRALQWVIGPSNDVEKGTDGLQIWEARTSHRHDFKARRKCIFCDLKSRNSVLPVIVMLWRKQQIFH
jgi:hypothetical protein